MSDSHIACKTVLRHHLHGAVGSHGAADIDVVVKRPAKLTLEDMAQEINHANSVTEADVHAVLKAVQHCALRALMQGQDVELGDLGTLSLQVHATVHKTVDETLRSDEVAVSRVSFKPSAALTTQLAGARFKVENMAKPPLSPDELRGALQEHFAQYGSINVRQFAQIGNMGKSAARRQVKLYVEQGLLEMVPQSNYVYRPTDKW